MKEKLNKESILNALTWMDKIKIPSNSYIISFGAAMVLRDLKDEASDIDIHVSLPWFIILYAVQILSIFRFIPKGIHICPKFIHPEMEVEILYGYNVQTIDSIIFEKLKRGRDADIVDIRRMNKINDSHLYKMTGANEFKIVHLLGKTRGNLRLFREVERELTLQGYICFAPVIYTLDEYYKYADLLDDMCYQKLLMTDICVIVTPDHIGRSTTKRIQQCQYFGIPVYLWKNGKLIEYK